MKPHILVFSTAYFPFSGGVETSIYEVSRRLSRDFDFTIITARMRRDLPTREIRPEGNVVRIGFGHPFDKWLLPVFGFWYAVRKFGRSKNTVLWGMDISQGSVAALLVKRFRPRVPFVLSIQYGYGDDRLEKGRGGIIGRAFRSMVYHADHITALSTYLADSAHAYGALESVSVIPNGVTLSEFHPAMRDAAPRPPTIITTSRLVQKNAVDVLIRAVAIIKKKIPDIRCVICGDGPLRDSLERLSRECGVTQNVEFLGDVPYRDIPHHVREADIFVRASRSEGLGVSFVEALAAGLPIIGTMVGGIPDIIRDGETGLFARVDDPEDLARQIERLVRDPALSRAIVAEGQAMIRERFEWDAIALSYASAFNRVRSFSKRVLVATGLFPPDIGGPATYSKFLLDELPHCGIGIRVLSFGSVRHLPKLARHLAYFGKVFRAARGSDCVFAQDPVSVGLPAMCAAFLRGKKFFVRIAGDYAWEQGMQRWGVKELLDDFLTRTYGRRIEFVRSIQHMVARRAQAIIVPSIYFKSVIRRWGIDEKKIHVVYSSVACRPEMLSKAKARKELRLSGTILVSSGRLVPWKGFDTLIWVCKEVSREVPDLHVLITGSGPEERSLRALAEQEGLGDRVTIGPVPHAELYRYLRAADVFVLNTGYEGLSHQILEVMCVGTPVITTAVGGNPEIITDGVEGMLVPYNDAAALKRSIITLLRNPALQARLAENARRKISGFSKEDMIIQTAKLLNTL